MKKKSIKKNILKPLCTLLFCGAILLSSGCDKSIKIDTGLKDNVIFKLSNNECSKSEILLVLVNEKNKYEADFGSGIWDKEIDGKTMESIIKESVKDRQIYLEVMYQAALDKKIQLEEDEKKAIAGAAEEYYESLSQEEIDKLNINSNDIYNIYEKCLLSEKLYDYITSDVEYEVSDEEARVMEVMYIYVSNKSEGALDKINEAYVQIQNGADFYNVALEYTDDPMVQIDLGRGQTVEEVEEKAFKLRADETTEIITTDNGYYIVKCVVDYQKDKTENNKEEILNDIKNKRFLEEINPFMDKQTIQFNDDVWEKIRLKDYSECTKSDLFDLYDKYLQ